jgi:WD40 repeat protein/tRNA A-37 threonylcarbamoyl transferase component Bud32
LLGRFRLQQRVGQGTFGVVWRAFDTHLHRLVALKIPHSNSLQSAGFLDRFWREAQAAAVLRHPGIVPVHQVITESGVTAIVSDFVEGVTLKDLLEVRKLSFDESARLVAEVAEALHHAHDKGLVHRDIKPANLMIEIPGGEMPRPNHPLSAAALAARSLGRPVIVDFGLALRDTAEVVLTLDGDIVGTPAYMSPEQAAGRAHQADRRSDVYSLGVVLYQLLCSETPFRGSWHMVIQQVLNEEPRPPRRSNDKVPRDLETICLKAMAKEPGWRYPTALAMAEDLRRYLDRRPILARDVGKPELLWRWARRNPALAVASGLAGGAALAFIALLVLFAVHKAQSVTNLSRLSASFALDNGLSRCDRGEVPAGLLWLARALQLAPAGAADLDRVIRLNLSSWSGQSALLEAFSPGAKQVNLASAAAGGTALLIVEDEHYVQLRNLPRDGSAPVAVDVRLPVAAATIDSGGKIFATAHGDSTARIWDASTGKPIGKPIVHPKPVFLVTLSADGKTLATAARDRKVRVFSVQDGTLVAGPFEFAKPIETIALGVNAGLLAVGSRDRKILIWDLRAGRKQVETESESISAQASFSPDGKRLAMADADQMARLWDTTTGRLIGSPMAHEEPVRVVAFSNDGKSVLTASFKSVRLWNALTAQPIGPSLLHESAVLAAVFRPDDMSFVSASADGSIRLWRRSRTDPQRRLASQGDIAYVAFSHDGRHVVTAGGRPTRKVEARLWHLEPDRLVAPPFPLSDSALTCSFDRRDQSLLIATQEGTVLLVDVATGNMRLRIKEIDLLSAAAFCSLDRLICTGTVSGKVRVWDPETGEPCGPSLTLSSAITALQGSPTTNMVLVGTQDGTVGVWDTRSGEFKKLQRHAAHVMFLRFGAEGTTVISGSWDHTACIHRVGSDGKERDIYLEHGDEVTALCVSPDGRSILTGCADHSVHVWDAATGRPFGAPVEHRGLVAAVEFADAGRLIVTGGWDQVACLWDVATRRPVGPPIRHQDSVQAIAVGPRGSAYVTGSFDGTARVCRVPHELAGDARRLAIWCEVITGMELDTSDSIHVLDAATWNDRRRELERLGGPPPP